MLYRGVNKLENLFVLDECMFWMNFKTQETIWFVLQCDSPSCHK